MKLAPSLRSPLALCAGLTTLALLSACTAVQDLKKAMEPAPPPPPIPASLPAAQPGELRACETLAAEFKFDALVIDAAQRIPAGELQVGGQPIGAHCRITGRLGERVSEVDQQTYAIGFEMRLPQSWSGRYLYQANGGLDGNVQPAVGAWGGGPLTNGLHQGFAVISSDAGHNAKQNPGFGLDPQARLDYGYQAAAKLTPLAKALIRAAYGKGPDRSYFAGCSNGGRHALVAAVRQSDEYDGILAGAPGWRLPLAALANIAGAQLYATVATASPIKTPADLGTAFTPAERALLSRSVAARCDAIDGLLDGMVLDTAACQQRFNLATDVPTCSGERNGQCLSAAQKQVIARIFDGPRLKFGQRIYSSFPFDTGHGAPGVAFWEFTASLNLDSAAVGIVFGFPPAAYPGFDGPAFTLGADLDAQLKRMGATDGTYTEAGLGFMMPPNAADLGRLAQRGGRVLLYHGVSDAIFSADDTVAWLEAVRAKARERGDDADRFARYFPVPGMGHCSGGPATDQFDMLTPLVAWVERGQAPQQITAGARGVGNAGGVNADLPPDWPAARSRPLCPWPKVAQFRGLGNPELAEEFVCR